MMTEVRLAVTISPFDHRLVVKIDADDRIGPGITGFLVELVEGDPLRSAQLLLIRRRAAANDVADAGRTGRG